MNPSIIRPGLLVALRSTLTGGVSYQKRTLDPEHMEGASAVARWETTRQIEDAAEHAAAVVARGAARAVITRICCASSFGLLCPQSREAELSAAVDEARAIADRHNAAARCTRVAVFVLTGRVADNDAEAARAIGAEVRELLGAMESAVRAVNPEAIREAASKARALAGMLTDDTQRKVTAAIAEVRAVARDMVKRAGESGELAAVVAQDIRLDALASARFAVLDLTADDEPEPEAAPLPSLAVDLPTDEPEALAAAPEPSPSLELF